MAAKATKRTEKAKRSTSKIRGARRGKPSKRGPSRPQATLRSKRIRQPKSTRPWWEVWVEFETSGVHPLDLDVAVERAAGKKRTGSGCDLRTGARDHSYTVGNRQGAVRMAVRLLDALAKIRWVSNFEVRILRRAP